MPSAVDPAGSAAADIAAAIAAGGPISFDRFMALALYGPNGFYERGGRAGRRGDFITSPEVGPLFGAVVAAALDAWWDGLDRPDPFVVVDAGAGPGALGRSIVAAGARCGPALRMVAVEISAAQRARHHPSIESAATMPDGPVHVVLANELLDNLPFRLLVFDGGWREAMVALDASSTRFVEVLRPLQVDLPWLPARPPHGARVPWQEAASAWVVETRRRALGPVAAFDYVTPRTAELAVAPWRDWLRTYRQHERGGHYLAAPGDQDVTAQVALDQLPVPDAVRSQAQFLERWGIEDLVEEGRVTWAAAASAPTVAAMAMRSRVREAEALLDPSGLGSFTVLEWWPGDRT